MKGASTKVQPVGMKAMQEGIVIQKYNDEEVGSTHVS